MVHCCGLVVIFSTLCGKLSRSVYGMDLGFQFYRYSGMLVCALDGQPWHII